MSTILSLEGKIIHFSFKVKCECNPGYEGDGTSCREINPCLKDNGKCSPLVRKGVSFFREN